VFAICSQGFTVFRFGKTPKGDHIVSIQMGLEPFKRGGRIALYLLEAFTGDDQKNRKDV
jgi:hypothetical protein